MTVAAADLIAIDWGTTNRRIYVLDSGIVVHEERDDQGATCVTPGCYDAELATIRARFGDLPVVMAGMVGSTVGWRVAPYVPVPAGIDDLARALLWIDARTAIVPGLSLCTGDRADVMRGEEVQVLGAVAAGLVPGDAVLVQPGTHCKWATIADGRVTGFTTAMTGELFALLKGHSLLAAQLQQPVTAGAAFLAGVDAGRHRDLAASLFGMRASALLGQRDDADAASYASGLLIGAEVAARLADAATGAVHIVDDGALGPLYRAALSAHGVTASIVSSRQAFVAGIIAIGKHRS